MIRWDQPVETTEDPPRPVRVLFDARGRRRAAEIGEKLYSIRGLMGQRAVIDETITLRNVTQPKPEPVLIERWVALYSDYAGILYSSKAAADEMARGSDPVECRRIAWMSDGSPVPGDAPHDGHSWVRYAAFEECKAERDAAQAEVSDLKLRWEIRCRAVKDALDYRRINETEALKAEIGRMKSVVDAAVAWGCSYGADGYYPTSYLGELFHKVRAYLAPQTKPVEDTPTQAVHPDFDMHDVATMFDAIVDNIEPVKTCLTCKHNSELWRAGPRCRDTGCAALGPYNNPGWEPKE